MRKRGSPPVTSEMAAHIKYLLQRGDLFQQQVAALLGLNQGRVSEIKTGLKFAEVRPAKGPFPA